MERNVEDVAGELGTIRQALLERANGATLLRNSLVGIVNHLSGTIDRDTEGEIEGVIGLIDSLGGSLNYSAQMIEYCEKDLKQITEANAGRPS